MAKIHLDYLKVPARHRLNVLSSELNPERESVYQRSMKLPAMIFGEMDKVMSRDGRIAFFRWAFNDPSIVSSHDLNPEQIASIVAWADPRKISLEAVAEWTYSGNFTHDIHIIKDALGKNPEPEKVRCEMCQRGKIERIIRSVEYPFDLNRAIIEMIDCRCCLGNYEDCQMCRSLGSR